ncbi:hypothetical protein [Tenacibaculum caenipelagi]|uniref:Uncharacterized protein n=1 Tax=Tenacibaculum caenipelagi TaxID=1325435 RepID=A0A4R6TGE0_9FLAO|nr:hypothetical protein [Tenacibaculum caenipelagi]TDQ27806.1 hypothetical protein DFQ07_1661 [Tenacibaculum caenipelagi]
MIRLNNSKAAMMEFTSFEVKEGTTPNQLIEAVLNFESNFLQQQSGIIFHCLVRNMEGKFANVLFAEDKESLKQLEKSAEGNQSVKLFFDMVEPSNVQVHYNTINKENFEVPESFSCVEYGVFKLKEKDSLDSLLLVSQTIEKDYLHNFKNTKEHFIGTLPDKVYTEVVLGETLGQTKQICTGYLENQFCKTFLEMIDESTMQLDFWYLIA